ncbi:MAG: helix-turn-helix domain-containing protein [Promethearchaeota archaeon]
MESGKFRPIQEKLIETLKKNGPLNRDQLVSILNIPRTTIYDNISELIRLNIVKKFTRQINSRGRPKVFFKLKEE